MPFMPTRPHAPAHSRVRGEESCACSGVRSAEPLGSCGVCKACELFGAPKSLEYLQLGHTTRTRRVAHAVPGDEAHRTKVGDVHAERALGPSWTPRTRGARSARTSAGWLREMARAPK